MVFDARTYNEDDVIRFQEWLEAPRGQFQWIKPSGEERDTAQLLVGADSGVLVLDTPVADPVEAEEETPVEAGASIEEIASRIYQLSDLSDEELARVFQVTRETFNRWRSGALTNPTVGSRRRAGLLLRLFEDLDTRRVTLKDWLLNTPTIDDLTPYELLVAGRLDEVAYLAAGLVEPGVSDAKSDERLEEELVFGEDDRWEVVELEDADDDE